MIQKIQWRVETYIALIYVVGGAAFITLSGVRFGVSAVGSTLGPWVLLGVGAILLAFGLSRKTHREDKALIVLAGTVFSALVVFLIVIVVNQYAQRLGPTGTNPLLAQITEGLNIAGGAKRAVTEYYQDRGVFPADNAEAGVTASGNIRGKYVDSVSINGAVITIQYGNDADAQISGKTVTLTATDNLGSLNWACASGGVIRDEHMPPGCRR